MIKCIAIDDEELALELLVDNIKRVPFLELVAACNDPLEAIHIMQQQPVDLVFLDIQMPGLTGLQLIQSSRQKPMFILVTAYEKYALEGYSLDVVDYLLKPVELQRFIKACNKAHELYMLKQEAAGRSSVVEKENETPGYFFVNLDYSLVKVEFPDIIYIEGLKDYVKIHLKSTGKYIIPRVSMKSLEEQLPSSQFLRIHKSYIVSKSSITAIRKSSVFLDEIELPVGENYRDAVDAFTKR